VVLVSGLLAIPAGLTTPTKQCLLAAVLCDVPTSGAILLSEYVSESRLFYSPLPKNVLQGLAHPWIASSGNTPGLDFMCREVERRLDCTATKLPPTPATL
jgi:hypothetical protein